MGVFRGISLKKMQFLLSFLKAEIGIIRNQQASFSFRNIPYRVGCQHWSALKSQEPVKSDSRSTHRNPVLCKGPGNPKNPISLEL